MWQTFKDSWIFALNEPINGHNLDFCYYWNTSSWLDGSRFTYTLAERERLRNLTKHLHILTIARKVPSLCQSPSNEYSFRFLMSLFFSCHSMKFLTIEYPRMCLGQMSANISRNTGQSVGDISSSWWRCISSVFIACPRGAGLNESQLLID